VIQPRLPVYGLAGETMTFKLWPAFQPHVTVGLLPSGKLCRARVFAELEKCRGGAV
jgi:hypothetical protein